MKKLSKSAKILLSRTLLVLTEKDTDYFLCFLFRYPYVSCHKYGVPIEDIWPKSVLYVFFIDSGEGGGGHPSGFPRSIVGFNDMVFLL